MLIDVSEAIVGLCSRTVHSLLVQVIDPIICVDLELVLLIGILDLANLILLIEEVSKLFEVGGKGRLLRQGVR